MVIGDLVRETGSRDRLALVQASAAGLSGGYDADALVNSIPFVVTGGAKFHGLTALLDHFHTSFSYGTGFGVEAVAVPFSHLFFQCAQPPSHRDRLAIDAMRRIDNLWKGAIDPLLGARAEFIETPGLAPDALRVFFGGGVFVPTPGVSPSGVIEIEAIDGGGAIEPLLGPEHRPAGFYPGQSALAFASLPALAPAVIDTTLDQPLCMLLSPGGSFPTRPLRLQNLNGSGSDAGYAARRNVPEHEPDGDDVEDEFVVTHDEAARLLVRYRADVRESRLRRRRRPGRFAVTGIVEPHDGRWPLSDHWWIDLDAEYLMLGSALVPKARSIAVLTDRIRCYDWRTFQDDRKAALAFTLETAATRVGDDKGLRLLRRTDGLPLGYLERPAQPRPVSFISEGTAEDCYALDWVDLTAGAEVALRREGLGSLSRLVKGHDISFGPRGAPWAARAPGGLLYRESAGGVFERRNEVPWHPGGQFALEPLCLTMLDGDEGR